MKEALAGPDKVKWEEAIKKEINNFLTRKYGRKYPEIKWLINKSEN